MNQVKDKVKKARSGINALQCKHCRAGLVIFSFTLKTLYELRVKGGQTAFRASCGSCKRENVVLFY